MEKRQTRCRVCLLRDTLNPQAYAQTVGRAKNAIPERMRTPDDLYEARLDACRACEHLQNGTCMRCGCLVEVRALRRDSRCPPPLDRWRLK